MPSGRTEPYNRKRNSPDVADQVETIEISNLSALPANPLVSVYTLAYRHEKFIADAIEGVISQQCDFPIELIIGEDCSPDRTREIVLDYQRRYPQLIRVLTSRQNVGAYANARRCQLATRGKFIAMCEGDDFWHHPQKLQMQVNLMNENQEMAFCHTDFDRKTRFRTWRSKHKNHPSSWLAKGNAYVALLHEWSVMTATCMFRRDVMMSFMGTEFDNPNWPFGDRNKLLYASQFGVVGYIDVSTTTFRKVRGSAMNKSMAARLNMELATYQCVSLFLERYPADPVTDRVARARLKRKIYAAAFYAARTDIMQSAYEWLYANGYGASLVSHRIRVAAISTKLPIMLLRKAKHFIDTRLSAIPS